MRTMIEHGRAALWAAFLLVLTGCAIQGVPEAQSPQERIVREAIRAQKMADAADLTVIDALNRKLISSDTAEEIGEKSDIVRTAARGARTALAVDWNNTTGALAYLQAADSALKVLDSFLRANQ